MMKRMVASLAALAGCLALAGSANAAELIRSLDVLATYGDLPYNPLPPFKTVDIIFLIDFDTITGLKSGYADSISIDSGPALPPDSTIFAFNYAGWPPESIFTNIYYGGNIISFLIYDVSRARPYGVLEGFESADGNNYGTYDVVVTGTYLGGDVPLGIPEPATWVLTTLGLFGAGLALRNRRTVPSPRRPDVPRS